MKEALSASPIRPDNADDYNPVRVGGLEVAVEDAEVGTTELRVTEE